MHSTHFIGHNNEVKKATCKHTLRPIWYYLSIILSQCGDTCADGQLIDEIFSNKKHDVASEIEGRTITFACTDDVKWETLEI